MENNQEDNPKKNDNPDITPEKADSIIKNQENNPNIQNNNDNFNPEQNENVNNQENSNKNKPFIAVT